MNTLKDPIVGRKEKGKQKRNKNKIVQYPYAINKTSYNQAINTLRGDYFHDCVCLSSLLGFL